MRSIGLALLLTALHCNAVNAQTIIAPSMPIKVQGKFDEADEDKSDGFRTAENISGIACIQGPEVARRHCLVINDEDVFAQRAVLEGGTMTVGDRVPLIGKTPPPRLFGKEPSPSCPEHAKEFKDLDGEAVAYAAPHFYVVGSHGCSRKKGKPVMSSFLLVRFRVDAEGKPLDIPKGSAPGTGVEATYRLAQVLAKSRDVGVHFGKALLSADAKTADHVASGLNIEGMAAIGGQLFVGLRAPSINGKGYIVRVPIADLFDAVRPVPEANVFELPFGPGTGIRDLAALPDGRLLVLGGPTEGQERASYPVFLLKPGLDGIEKQWQLALALHDKKGKPADSPGPGVETAKAEAMLFLGRATGGALRVLLMFDGIENGGPREYQLP